MTPRKIYLILVAALLVVSCTRAEQNRATLSESTKSGNSVPSDQPALELKQQMSLQQVDQVQSQNEAVNRKIIRDANISLEVAAPSQVQHEVNALAESIGGFVVTSEAKRREGSDQTKPQLEITLVVRVPSTQFFPTLEKIRSFGSRVLNEKVTGQDVTEEFIDLEARIKTQKALEAQFLEIMKQAGKVSDALEVQRQIAEVRTEIERLEGRKRFLESRSSLSTITVSLQEPAAIVVSSSSFGRSIKEAVRDAVDIAGEIILFFIRFIIVMIPIFLLIILPIGLIARFIWRRARRRPRPESVVEENV
ncbi:MAG TPA: DUF4349 domain-containing protein [Pyrinomonadaceae bacterium]|nr:DUF4349 domain-containing protein [Pyrinomonadaceae bacterium]